MDHPYRTLAGSRLYALQRIASSRSLRVVALVA